MMTDIEFELLDELYFVKNIEELLFSFSHIKEGLQEVLWEMIEKKWVKILDGQDNELDLSKESYFESIKTLRFNITKKGLMAHNRI